MEHLRRSQESAPGCLGANGKSLFLALTFILVIIIVLICPDATTAILIIGLLLGFCAAYLSSGGGWGAGGSGGFSCDADVNARAPARKEGYWPLPGEPAPHAVASMTRPPADAGHYPGDIDIDEYDTEGAYGHRDATEGDADSVPMGNPYNTGRVSYAPSAAACIDDEANDAEIDADEHNTYQARSRNDATRVAAGTMNRRRDLDRFFREEVEEAEDREWWGRHEE